MTHERILLLLPTGVSIYTSRLVTQSVKKECYYPLLTFALVHVSEWEQWFIQKDWFGNAGNTAKYNLPVKHWILSCAKWLGFHLRRYSPLKIRLECKYVLV